MRLSVLIVLFIIETATAQVLPMLSDVQRRRVATVNPDTLLPSGIRNRWKASDLNASPVTSWVDSISGITFTNASSGPTWDTNGIHFDGSSQFLRLTGKTTASFVEHTNQVLLVARRTRATVSLQFILSSFDTETTYISWYNDSGSDAWLSQWQIMPKSPANVWQDWLYAGHNLAVSETVVYTNGVGMFSESAHIIENQYWGYLGVRGHATKDYWAQFDLREIIVWTNSTVPFTSTMISNIHSYVTNVYTDITP